MNKGPDHLSRLEHGEEPTSVEDTLPDAQLLAIIKIDDHFTEIVQFLSKEWNLVTIQLFRSSMHY
jgi:hypothetical protein